MVGRKRLGYGSRGPRVLTTPGIPNSSWVQGKHSTRRKDDDMQAFDLLASVAGMLLVDQDSSLNMPYPNEAEASYAIKRKPVKQIHSDEITPLSNMATKKDCCSGCLVGSGGINAYPNQVNACLEENSSTRNEGEPILNLLTLNSNGQYERSRGLGIIPECGTFGVRHLGSTNSAEAERVQEADPEVIRSQHEHITAIDSLIASVDLDGRPPALVSSDSSSGVPLCSHDKEPKTSSLCLDIVQHTAKRDDDENFSGCTHPSTSGNKGYKPHYLSDHRIRKLFASKARKATHTKIYGGVSSKGRKQNYCGRKISTARQKVQRTISIRKKLGRHQLATSSAKGMPTEVKLRIKSIKVPDLFIEIPENATVGSLKRTVMDVVSTVMEGGLRIGVLLHGQKIQDDNKTLCQAGICHGAKLNTIDFTMECEGPRDSPSGIMKTEGMDFSNADIVEPLARMKFEVPFHETKLHDDDQQPARSYPNCSFAGPGSVRCPIKMALQDTSASSQAIIPITPAELDALAIVPLCKPRRSETGQRRMRRPFSVGEVEALVETVELLGTGRWRDVKLHAFENTDHRTYVDLKDKWKTLVHTASIPPQQRRSMQVPQELLDRVLAAQAYWSQQQAKYQDKADLPSLE